jgi:hypothetical protein
MGIVRHVMTGHGFRAMPRTILDEVLGVRLDLIEHSWPTRSEILTGVHTTALWRRFFSMGVPL